MKVAIYCRVSTIEQVKEGYSIEEQQRKLESFCKINDWNKYETFVDAGISGSTTNRPVLKTLLHRLDEFDLVLVYKLDRLTRNVRDLLDMLDTFEQKNVSFRSATEVYDTSSAMGRLFVTLVGAMAEWERSTISERSEMGKLSAARQGVNVSKTPFFYDKVDGKLIVNEYAKVYRYMVDRVLNGASTVAIADELNASNYNHPNGLKWYPMMVRRTLKNIQARGHSSYKDILVKDTHEPLISEQEYNIVLSKLKERTHFSKEKHAAIFRGKLKCHKCNNNLTLGVNRKKTKTQGIKVYKRYYCDNCKENNIPASERITFNANVAEKEFLNHLSNLPFENYNTEKKEKSLPLIDIKKIENQRQKYQEAWSLGYMTDKEFYARMEDTQKVVDEYYKQIEENQTELLDIEEINNKKDIILKYWDELDDFEKENLINSSVKEIVYEYHKGNSRKNPSTIAINKILFYNKSS